jgi:fermentation-respiration switch protein FrsA (DUF1100 family)
LTLALCPRYDLYTILPPFSSRSSFFMSVLAIISFTLAGLILLALAALLIFTYLRAWSLTHPPRRPLTRTPADLGVAFEEVSFPTEDGITLSGWYIPARNGRTLVACHGIYDSREQFLEPAVALAKHGYGFLIYDARAHGKSGGTLSSFGYHEIKDVTGAVRYLQARPDVDANQLGIIGNSLGGITAIRAAARLPELRVIVSESAFADFARDISSAFTRFTHLPAFPFASLVIFWGERLGKINLDDIRPARDISALSPRPIFLISDLADDIVEEPLDGELLYANAGEPKELWQIPACRHVQAWAMHPEEYERRVVAFLDKSFAALAPAPAPAQTERARER